ncbi:MAG: DUF927 domain-containing protein [Paludibacteraceae bacterium]|nr:DUF927 domain-containing protein [Paludibacteraceae bacterium]
MNTEIVEVPRYDADVFYNSSAPFEWLYTFKDNKFLLSQMREKLKARANEVGVRGFISLWNAFLETKQQSEGISFDNATQFVGHVKELFSGQYICDEYGVITNDRYGYEQIICRHPIMPMQRLVNIDTGEERLKIAFKKGKSWRYIVVEKSVLASSNSILQLASNGVLVNSENAKALSTYLLEMEQLNYDEIDEQKSVNRLGWVGEHGFSPFVDNLEFDGENNFRHIFNSVKSNGDRQKWIDAMIKVRAEKTPARIALAASFASVLLEPCGLLPFFVHCWGSTEVGKSVLLMIASSVWANPKMGEYITTFNSTLVGQEMTASFLNSLPMCVDELQIQSSAGVKGFDKIIYQLAEGVGRTRGAKTGGLQKINTWKNCIITNGEHPISNHNSGGGAVNRIIEFECTEKIYSDLVGICEIIQENYGFAGRELVEHLQNTDCMEVIPSIQKDFYRQLLNYDSTEKQAASASAILTADWLVTQLIFQDDNALTVEEMASIMTKKSDVDVNARAYDFILELATRNITHFQTSNFGEYQGEVWGKIDNEYIYIIKSVFDREMQNAGFNSTSFLAWAKRKNIVDSNDNRRTKNVRVAGSVTNCVCIRKKMQKEDEF